MKAQNENRRYDIRENIQEKKRIGHKTVRRFVQFSELGKHADSISNCSTYLLMSVYNSKINPADYRQVLSRANYCKNRFCPLCNWRKSRDRVFRLLATSVLLQKYHSDLKPIFLTLTLKNMVIDDLESSLEEINSAFDKMFKREKVYKINNGYVRNLEITYNKETDTYHPHLHLIILVPKDYFDKDKNLYIEQREWQRYWKEGLEVDYNPVVDIRGVKPNSKLKDFSIKLDSYKDIHIDKSQLGGIYETAKYAVKDTELLQVPEKDLVKFTKILKGVRNFNASRLFKTLPKGEHQLEYNLLVQYFKNPFEFDKDNWRFVGMAKYLYNFKKYLYEQTSFDSDVSYIDSKGEMRQAKDYAELQQAIRTNKTKNLVRQAKLSVQPKVQQLVEKVEVKKEVEIPRLLDITRTVSVPNMSDDLLKRYYAEVEINLNNPFMDSIELNTIKSKYEYAKKEMIKRGFVDGVEIVRSIAPKIDEKTSSTAEEIIKRLEREYSINVDKSVNLRGFTLHEV